MKTGDLLLVAGLAVIGFFLWQSFKKKPEPQATGVPPFNPPIKAGQERASFTGNPISASRSNEIFGAPQPPISNSGNNRDALVEQGIKFALSTKFVQDARAKYGF